MLNACLHSIATIPPRRHIDHGLMGEGPLRLLFLTGTIRVDGPLFQLQPLPRICDLPDIDRAIATRLNCIKKRLLIDRHIIAHGY